MLPLRKAKICCIPKLVFHWTGCFVLSRTNIRACENQCEFWCWRLTPTCSLTSHMSHPRIIPRYWRNDTAGNSNTHSLLFHYRSNRRFHGREGFVAGVPADVSDKENIAVGIRRAATWRNNDGHCMRGLLDVRLYNDDMIKLLLFDPARKYLAIRLRDALEIIRASSW